jgi:hypothetical protein
MSLHLLQMFCGHVRLRLQLLLVHQAFCLTLKTKCCALAVFTVSTVKITSLEKEVGERCMGSPFALNTRGIYFGEAVFLCN